MQPRRIFLNNQGRPFRLQVLWPLVLSPDIEVLYRQSTLLWQIIACVTPLVRLSRFWCRRGCLVFSPTTEALPVLAVGVISNNWSVIKSVHFMVADNCVCGRSLVSLPFPFLCLDTKKRNKRKVKANPIPPGVLPCLRAQYAFSSTAF